VNVKGYFTTLVTLLDHFVAEGFAREGIKSLYCVSQTVEDAIAYLDAHFAKVQAA
jgi:hypothetical protein